MIRPQSSDRFQALAAEVLARCDEIATFSEEPDRITRTFLSEPMHALHARLRFWFERAGMHVRRDAAANLIGRYPGERPGLSVLAIGSHLDTVPNAGQYDGVLGVLMGLAAVEFLAGTRLAFAIDVIGFSEEEGVRYRTPFLGSLAAAGQFDRNLLHRADSRGISMADAFHSFGLDPAKIDEAAYRADTLLGFVEVHIEQGPALERLDAPLGVVEAIAGQSRVWVELKGRAGHAGTTPMEDRSDALAAGAEVILAIEQLARSIPGLRATVGALAVEPGASNVIPGRVRLSADIRHAADSARIAAVTEVIGLASRVARRRGVGFVVNEAEHHVSIPADPVFRDWLAEACVDNGFAPHRLVSGAGHDAGIMARITRMAMLFLRSPGGVSHHPDERVSREDVAAGLAVLVRYLEILSARVAQLDKSAREFDPPGVL